MMIYVVGVGGVGGFYGGMLAKGRADVTFVSRGESYAAIEESGLLIKRDEESFRIFPKVIDSISEIKDPDLIVLAVKSYDLEKVSQELVSVVNSETIVITIQNGLENDSLVSQYLKCKVLPGLVLVAATKTAPSVITQKGVQKKLVFGSRTRKITKRMMEIEAIFKNCGIDAEATEEIKNALWKKFLFVVSFSSATIAGMCPIGKALKNPDSLKVYRKVLTEAIVVGRAEGVKFEDNIFKKTLQGAQNFDPTAKSSLLVDLENKRQTEVETLQGTLITLAKKNRIDVPETEKIYGVIKEFLPL